MNLTKRNYEKKGRIDVIETDTHVCSKHFNDFGLSRFVIKNGEEVRCSYCEYDDEGEKLEGREDEDMKTEYEPAVLLSELISYMLDCIAPEYDRPGEWMYFESAEGGYLGAEVYDTRELLTEVIGLDLDHDGLYEDIIGSIANNEWCARDPYGDTKSKALLYTWQNFSQIVKHKTRYVFFKNKYKEARDLMEPFDILDHIGRMVHGTKQLFNTSHSETGQAYLFDKYQFYRARQHSKRNEAKFVDGLGSPPPFVATVNRMSPAGISMFYCSDNEQTAIAETLNRRNRKAKYITTGCFENLRPLTLINLDRLREISIFDADKSEFYQAMLFLRLFRAEISKTVARDGKEHFDYVPTQIVTEYFRDVFPVQFGVKIDGIQYPSVKNKGQSCFVLFFEQADLIDQISNKRGRPVKKLIPIPKSDPSLMLLNKTVKTTLWK